MVDRYFWPDLDVFYDLSRVKQQTDGKVRCTAVAVCNEDGQPTREFYQGQMAHFFYEFEVLAKVGVPSGGLALYDRMGRVIHGKNTFQSDTDVPHQVYPGTILRFHQTILLEVGPGEYSCTIGFASTDGASYQGYREGPLTHEEFGRLVQEHCRVMGVGAFVVGSAPGGKLLHHGLANLPGDCQVRVLPSPVIKASAGIIHDRPAEMRPTIFHITHMKAGSQWIYRILLGCAPDRTISTEQATGTILYKSVQAGKIYPTVYLTKGEFDKARIPANSRRFIVIRDLRDTLISGYFSLKISHPVQDWMTTLRTNLQSLGLEEGLNYLMTEWLSRCADIQLSWLESGERLIHYEDLLEHDLEILEPLLLDECELSVSRERLRKVIRANRFEHLTGGRKRGQEDIKAHERKGIAGDWRNHFTAEIKQAFKDRYGSLLMATGYEKDLNW